MSLLVLCAVGALFFMMMPDKNDVYDAIKSFSAKYPSIWLLVALAISTPTHESRPYSMFGVVASGVVLYYVSSMERASFYNCLALIMWKLPLYLCIGVAWSCASLFLNVWRGHLDPTLTEHIAACHQQYDCIVQALPLFKSLMITYTLHWPANMALFLLRDPIYIALDLAWYYMRNVFVNIIIYASAMRID